LCNKLYFLSLARDLPALFVHIPALQTADGLFPRSHEGNNILTIAQAIEGLTIMARIMARQDSEGLA